MNTFKKLSLTKDTLLALDAQDASAVVGGIAPPPDYTEVCTIGCGVTNQCHWTVQATNCQVL